MTEIDTQGTSKSPIDELNARVQGRTGEIEAALIEELFGVHDPAPENRAELLAGIQASTTEGMAYTLAAFQQGEEWSEPLPESLAAQARWAARVGVPLDELLRAYAAGNTVISRFVTEELVDLPPEALRYAVEVQNRVADALVSGFFDEYTREAAVLDRSTGQRLAQQVEGILAGQAPAEDFTYQLARWHIAAVVTGFGADQAARLVAERLGCDLLLISRSAGTHWAWWGSGRRVPFSRVDRVIGEIARPVSFAVGDPQDGLEGFRRSHREAQIGSEVMVHSRAQLIRGTDVALTGLLLRDDELAELLVHAQLGMLKAERDWPTLRETLDAYVDSDGALATTAAVLGVDRQTVKRRLQRIERLTERPIRRYRAELEVALRLERIADRSRAPRPPA
jgi:PucR-like helix-turn-helix protein/diguanylate cyclase with GGDEF domain